MKYTFSFVIIFTLGLSTASLADDHDHDHKEEVHKHSEESGHSEEEKSHEDSKGAHTDEDEQGHEESSQVGPDKGILEASENLGIRLSPEAEKNFEIARIKIATLPIQIPVKAVVSALNERNIYRYRNGFYKRIDFDTDKKSNGSLLIHSRSLKIGDEVVIQGLGFLRVSEIAAFGGAPEGHSH